MNLFGPSSGFGGGGGILGGFGAKPAAATPSFGLSTFGAGVAPFGGGLGGSNGGLGAPALGVVRNTWVPDAGEERFVICHGLRGSVSSLSWFSAHPMVALTTWDGEIQVLKVQQQQLQVMANLHLSASTAPPGQQASPLLSSACQGTTVAVGGCDGKLRVWNPEQGTTAIAEWGAHADAIKKVMVLESSEGWPAAGFLTGSFDKTVALWSAPGQPAAKIDARFKVYAMDGLVPYILLAGSDRHVSLRDLRKSGEAVYSGFSPLQWQTRCACLIPGQNGSQEPYGFSIGGIDGTLGVVPFERHQDAKRIEVTTSPSKGPRNSINEVCRLPNHADMLMSFGGDGKFHIWNISSFLGKGMPEYTSTDPLPGRPPATGSGVQAKIWPSVSAVSWKHSPPGNASILAFANSPDSMCNASHDYMSDDAQVQSLGNVVRFWCFQ